MTTKLYVVGLCKPFEPPHWHAHFNIHHAIGYANDIGTELFTKEWLEVDISAVSATRPVPVTRRTPEEIGRIASL